MTREKGSYEILAYGPILTREKKLFWAYQVLSPDEEVREQQISGLVTYGSGKLGADWLCFSKPLGEGEKRAVVGGIYRAEYAGNDKWAPAVLKCTLDREERLTLQTRAQAVLDEAQSHRLSKKLAELDLSPLDPLRDALRAASPFQRRAILLRVVQYLEEGR